MKIGYSFWGFLGPGITDTPDGGRSHRLAWVEGLRSLGHEVVFLQRDRDRLDARSPIGGSFAWDAGLPSVDLLFLEWRWAIPGRNDAASRLLAGWTPDVDRQDELLRLYTRKGVPTVIWDKDLRLSPSDPVRQLPNVVVAEAALRPRSGAEPLLFPVRDRDIDRALLSLQLAGPHRQLVYVGNQYRRDEDFDRFIAGPAHLLSHDVFGKWNDTSRWSHVQFRGRIPFARVREELRASLLTVAVVPPEYAAAGQMTQRLAEAALAGCIPLVPNSVRCASHMVPSMAVVTSAEDVTRMAALLTDSDLALELLEGTLERLKSWRLSRQLERFAAMVAPFGRPA